MAKTLCSIAECEGEVIARGWCNKHWARWKRRGDPLWNPPTVAERFWSKVEKTDDCWFWQGGKSRTGYGTFTINGGPTYAHRWSYESEVAPIPAGLEIDHLCRVRNCVRPDHLEAVTAQINQLRGQTLSAFNAAKTHCPQGHEYTAENTGGNGVRWCRRCKREKNKPKVPTGRPPGRPPQTECKHGHPFPENRYVSPKGRTQCRICILERSRAQRERRKSA